MSGATDSDSDPKALPASTNGAPALPTLWAVSGALACGVCYFLAFPGIDVWPLGFVALIPLRLALLGQTPKRAFWLGWLSGLTMISIGFYWMVGMMRQFSGFPTVICIGMLLIVNAFQAGRMGLFAWLFVRGARRFPAGSVWLCALVTSELVFPVLFFWSFGAVVHGQPALTQLADIGGIYAIALVMAAANFGLSEFAVARLQKRSANVKAALPY